MSDDINVGLRIDLKGDLQQQLVGVRGQFSQMQQMTKVMSLASLGQSLGHLGQQAHRLTDDLKRPYIEFEREMVSVRARMLGISAAQYQELRQQAKELGATTIFTSQQVAQGMNKLAMAGFDADEIKASIADVTAFVQANDIDFGTGADIATDIGTAFGYQAGELGEVMDVLTLAASSANTDISMLGETMKYAAADAKSLGLSLEETTAMAGLLANAGIKGSLAGTRLKEMIKSLAVPDDAANEALDRLGIKVYDDAGKMRSITKLLRDVNQATKGLKQKQRAKEINTIFGERGSAGILTLMSQGQDEFEKFLALLEKSAEGTVRKMQDIMAKSLAAGLAGINSRKEALFSTITEHGREQLVGIQQLKIGFLDHLNNIAKENSVLSGRISLATQLLSDIGGVLTSSGAVLSTVLSGFTALSMYKNQRAVQSLAANPQGILGGVSPSQPLPVWVVNNSKQGSVASSALPVALGAESGNSKGTTKSGFWYGKKGHALKGGLASLAFGGVSMGLEALAIRQSKLSGEEQEKAYKSVFNRNAWGMFGSTAGAVIGSVIAPGIGTVIGGSLGQFVGDIVAGLKEHQKTDKTQYKKFLKQQQSQYKARNDQNYDPLTGIRSGFGKYVNKEYDSSIDDVRALMGPRNDLMIYEQTGQLRGELQKWIGENIATPELMATELMNMASDIQNSGIGQEFLPTIKEYTGEGQSVFDVQAPFLEMFAAQLPQDFIESDRYKNAIQGINQDILNRLEKDKGVDTKQYIPDLAKALNQFNFDKTQKKEEATQQGLELQRQIHVEIQRGNELTNDMLKKLENRPFVLKVGGSP